MMLEILKTHLPPGEWYVYENKTKEESADISGPRVHLLVDQRRGSDGAIRFFPDRLCPDEIGTTEHLPYLIAHPSPIPAIPERFLLVHLPAPEPRNVKTPVPRGWKEGEGKEGDPVLLRDPWSPGGWARHTFEKEYTSCLTRST